MLFVNSGMAAVGTGFDGPSYEDWLAHITSRAPDVVGWTSTGPTGNGLMRVAATGAFSGDMYGSPWGSLVLRDFSIVNRIVQHSAPSAPVANEQVSSSRTVLLAVSQAGTSIPPPGQNRNGYPSITASDGEAYPLIRITEFSYWDAGLSAPMTSNPSISGSSIPYSAPGWSL
jgi:hypothetical protein